MTPDSATKKLTLEILGRRRVEADFSAGHVSSDGGGLLLGQVDQRLKLTKRMAECFTDHRNPDLIEHTVADLMRQRIYGIALGYEDLNDHERISRDPLLATLVGKIDPTGDQRRLERDRGKPLASASTLGRIERTPADADNNSRYAKVVCDFEALGKLFAKIFIESFDSPPLHLTLDLDPSDVAVHGEQEERFYHGYYGQYCYLPMYLYCGQHPLAVKLRPSNIDGALGAAEFLEPVVTQLREKWPDVRILIRGDSGFCREGLMAWCETKGVDFVLGLARKSWSRKRRVVGKAEYSAKGANPRFVVTSLPAREYEKRYLYEELYCARGEMENRIKEQQLDLFGDRASCHAFRGNEIRLWLSMAAHVLIVGLRRLALVGTELAQAQAGTLRVRLLKIGALVTVSVRRIYIQLSSAFPLQELLALALRRLRGSPIAPAV